MIVKLKRNFEEYKDLTYGQYYVVIGIEADEFRLLNDQGRPYLYPPQIFQIIDYREPSDWISETGENGEKYAYPPQLNHIGFFEDFFDGKESAVSTFWRIVNQHLVIASEAA